MDFTIDLSDHRSRYFIRRCTGFRFRSANWEHILSMLKLSNVVLLQKMENWLNLSEERKYFTDWRADCKVCDKRYFELWVDNVGVKWERSRSVV